MSILFKLKMEINKAFEKLKSKIIKSIQNKKQSDNELQDFEIYLLKLDNISNTEKIEVKDLGILASFCQLKINYFESWISKINEIFISIDINTISAENKENIVKFIFQIFIISIQDNSSEESSKLSQWFSPKILTLKVKSKISHRSLDNIISLSTPYMIPNKINILCSIFDFESKGCINLCLQ